MEKTVKKMLSVAMAVSMVVSVCSFSVLATDDNVTENSSKVVVDGDEVGSGSVGISYTAPSLPEWTLTFPTTSTKIDISNVDTDYINTKIGTITLNNPESLEEGYDLQVNYGSDSDKDGKDEFKLASKKDKKGASYVLNDGKAKDADSELIKSSMKNSLLNADNSKVDLYAQIKLKDLKGLTGGCTYNDTITFSVVYKSKEKNSENK